MSDAVTAIIQLFGLIINTEQMYMLVEPGLTWLVFLLCMAICVLLVRWTYERWTG